MVSVRSQVQFDQLMNWLYVDGSVCNGPFQHGFAGILLFGIVAQAKCMDKSDSASHSAPVISH